MRWWRQRKESEQDLERELRSDLELEAEEQRENGLSPEEAGYAARRKFGNVTLIREEIYRMDSIELLEAVIQDLRHGLRVLRTFERELRPPLHDEGLAAQLIEVRLDFLLHRPHRRHDHDDGEENR